MRTSYTLGRVAGIEIGINWSVLALLEHAAATLRDPAAVMRSTGAAALGRHPAP